MAWVKIPAEHHPLFRAAIPKDPRVQTLQMFGGVAGKINGHMFGGLFARSVVVRLGDADRAKALALDGAVIFDPMGNGRVMKDMVVLPEDVLHDPAELRAWLKRAIDATAALPAKRAKKPAAKKAPAKKPSKAKPATASRAVRSRRA